MLAPTAVIFGELQAQLASLRKQFDEVEEVPVSTDPGQDYPVKFVEKRWYRREAGFLASSFEAICEDLAAVAGGRSAKHWPW